MVCIPDSAAAVLGRPRPAPIVSGTVVCVDVEHLPKPTSRTKKTLWLSGSPPAQALTRTSRSAGGPIYAASTSNTFRFLKNTLGWTTPRLCTPEQADLWTWVILTAYTQLRLACGLVEDQRLPWERRLKPGRLTPRRVRRGFPAHRPTLGTPASPPEPSRPGPGRPKAAAPGHAPATPRSKGRLTSPPRV